MILVPQRLREVADPQRLLHARFTKLQFSCSNLRLPIMDPIEEFAG